MKKNICVFTGSRADYGILKNLIIDLKNIKSFNTKLIVGGSHFFKKFGYTYKEIIKDGIKIDKKINLNLKETDNVNILNFISNSIKKYTKNLNSINPSIAIVLGDRFEAFSFAIACLFFKHQNRHIHGGEVTSGSFDDSIRHSISKLSNYHFVSNRIYKKRLIQLGENKKNIFDIGSLGVQNFLETKKDDKVVFLKKYKLPKNKKLILVTFHPETRSNLTYKKQIKIFLESIQRIENTYYIFTYNNMDTEGLYFIRQLEKFCKKNKNSRMFRSMGSSIYFNFLKNVDLIIGNSSSAIIEAPSAKIPTLNIGTRQNGRLIAKSVYSCSLKKKNN